MPDPVHNAIGSKLLEMQAKGSKLTRSLSSLLLALPTAVFGTIVHQSSQFGIPLGLAISLTVVLLVSIQIRRRSGFRSPGVVFAAVLGICIWLFSQDLTGDKMIPSTTLGYAWSYGSIASAVLVAIWPRLTGSQWKKAVN